VAAAVGLLRNLSCSEDPLIAAELLSEDCIEATLRASFAAWVAPRGGEIGRSASLPRCRSPSAAQAPPSLTSPAPRDDVSPLESRLHLSDVRFAEDALLTLSNLLRFSEHQQPELPVQRIALHATTALGLFPRSAALHESGVRLLRYLSGVPGAAAADACVAGGAMRTLCSSLAEFPSDAELVESGLHVLCSLLVYEGCRRAEVCPFELVARSVVGVMARTEHANSASIQALGATVLRNLACVIPTPATEAPPRTVMSPALRVADSGAPAVLEAAMERLPDAPSVQESGRCALYNLLLIGASDAKAVVLRAQELELQLQQLQQRRRESDADSSIRLRASPVAAGPRSSLSARSSGATGASLSRPMGGTTAATAAAAAGNPGAARARHSLPSPRSGALDESFPTSSSHPLFGSGGGSLRQLRPSSASVGGSSLLHLPMEPILEAAGDDAEPATAVAPPPAITPAQSSQSQAVAVSIGIAAAATAGVDLDEDVGVRRATAREAGRLAAAGQAGDTRITLNASPPAASVQMATRQAGAGPACVAWIKGHAVLIASVLAALLLAAVIVALVGFLR
jgi:hypothetical protein